MRKNLGLHTTNSCAVDYGRRRIDFLFGDKPRNPCQMQGCRHIDWPTSFRLSLFPSEVSRVAVWSRLNHSSEARLRAIWNTVRFGVEDAQLDQVDAGLFFSIVQTLGVNIAHGARIVVLNPGAGPSAHIARDKWQYRFECVGIPFLVLDTH